MSHTDIVPELASIRNYLSQLRVRPKGRSVSYGLQVIQCCLIIFGIFYIRFL